MKWEKVGKIFDPNEHDLPQKCIGFAQGPQALVLEDRVRIFFSTREKDDKGKYLSHIAYVDFDHSFSEILDVATHTVIPLGGLGTFDEHGIFPIHISRLNDRVVAYTTGWNRKVSVPADASIGFAESFDDGVTFDKLGNGPVMTASLFEPFLVGDPFVQQYDDMFHMWYIFGSKWIKSEGAQHPERVYKIAHATSTDGIEWERNSINIISDAIGQNECQAYPTVFQCDGRYHMYFCYRDAFDFRLNHKASYKLGYAYSSDLINWHRDDSLAGIEPSASGWDSEMQCYPNVFELNGSIHLLYNGNEFGRNGFGLATLTNQ